MHKWSDLVYIDWLAWIDGRMSNKYKYTVVTRTERPSGFPKADVAGRADHTSLYAIAQTLYTNDINHFQKRNSWF
jgi:hypothetical protein